MSVKDYLLGAPFQYLANQGFIRERGAGFFAVTDDGMKVATSPDSSTVDIEVIAALQLLHPDFRDYVHYFTEGQPKHAVAAAFERYENRLNEIRDHSRKRVLQGVPGMGLPNKSVQDQGFEAAIPQPQSVSKQEKCLSDRSDWHSHWRDWLDSERLYP
jgi:hypothetical protein